MKSKNINKILIVDFGSQVTQLIARQVRELGVYCELINFKKFNKFKTFYITIHTQQMEGNTALTLFPKKPTRDAKAPGKQLKLYSNYF